MALRTFIMGPGWSRMLEKVLPGVIDRVAADGIAPGVVREACATGQ
jgi:hypothetical protein